MDNKEELFRRNAELEYELAEKINQLEIETALENVRTIALAMKEPADMLQVCKIISQQLEILRVKEIRNVQTAIINQIKGNYLNYEYFRLADKSIITEVQYNLQPDVKAFVTQVLADPEAFFTTAFEGDKLKEWLAYQEKANQFVDPHLYEVKSLHYYFFSIGPGAIGISTYEPLNDQEISILKRFRNVFGLAYRRFIDIEQAETQAREARIEVALERVRSRTMGMQKSEELQEVVNILFERLKELDIEVESANIAIFKEGTRDYDYWVASPFQKRAVSFHIPYTELSISKDFIAARESGIDFYAKAYSFEEKNEWFDYAFKNTNFKFLSEERKEFILNSKAVLLSIAFAKNTGVQVTNYSGKLLSESEADILKRFSKVFEQTYTRFLDLQKAEAQVREAQIELALERVRAKAMAMHHSDELSEVLSVLFDQFDLLGISPMYTFLSLIDLEKNSFTYRQTGRGGKRVIAQQIIDLNAMDIWMEVVERWKAAKYDTIETLHVPKESIPETFDVFREIYSALPEGAKVHPEDFPEGMHTTIAVSKFGHLGYDHFRPSTEDEKSILLRFNTEFVRLYQRFLDLQKAEAQTREARIEAALERVRSRTMAMQKSDELDETNMLILRQLESLDIPLSGTGIHICNSDKPESEAWMWDPFTGEMPKVTYNHTHDRLSAKIYEGWKKRETLYVEEVRGEKLKEHLEYISTLLPDPTTYGDSMPEYVFHIVYFKYGFIVLVTPDHRPTDHPVFIRFAKVFEQTFTRFLDVQKAEAQAREAQIEAALERVRARAMAMHSSHELQDVVKELRKQIGWIGQKELDTCVIQLYDESPDYVHSYASMTPSDNKGEVREFYRLTPKKGLYIIEEALQAYSSGKKDYVLLNEKEKSKQWMNFFKETYPDIYAVVVETLGPKPEEVPAYWSFSDFNGGTLLMVTLVPATSDSRALLRRFADVFGLAYRRFVDLKKAESQAREAQIEVALERIRAKALAMQTSNDLLDVANVLREQMGSLGQPELESSIVHIYNDDLETFEAWYAFSPPNLSSVEIITGVAIVPKDSSLWAREVIAKYKSSDTEYTIVASGQKLSEWYKILEEVAPGTVEYNENDQIIVPEILYYHFSNFSGGSLLMISNVEPSREARELQRRAALVFDLAYTRFLDLQKAEAQAREAQIELGLERVRAKAMAMQKSNELAQLVDTVFKELTKLHFTLDRCLIIIIDEKSRSANYWMANPESRTPTSYHLELKDIPYLIATFNAWKERKTKMVYDLKGDEKSSTVEYIFSKTELQLLPPEVKEGMKNTSRIFLNASFNNFGGLQADTIEPLSEDNLDILYRFAKVFDLTYTRFNDLQKAEAQAREAIRQASVDRVRAEIASMRTTNDLERITPLIWTELTTLGVPFIRCGVFIMDEKHQQVQSFLSTPDGKAIAAFRQTYSASEISNVVDSWHKKEMYRQHWDEAQFTEFTKNLVQEGAITSGEKYLTEKRPADLCLHFLPFLQGMLYVGNTTSLGDDELQLVQNLAEAFATAYARYEDFNKLEAAKKQVDSTLNELQATQKQLIQSEKMASLGELTAGIAHEIQNPLNFVNNFSEINRELLIEMKDEIERGSIDEAINIANSLIDNQEKINHHGKRADAIVKNMMQHSKTTSSQKEPTDINALVDEYLRLSYHGFRAKDNSFNAIMKTDFDESIRQINIIPQDIGRVLLNLYNNAFYAVNEKVKLSGNGYQPTVSVSTSYSLSSGEGRGEVLIKVKDNANGIPQSIVDKIFQPFFTTKPTGQGTGLGLSLSYDIIKAHSGKIIVETKEGEGSKFIIQLPSSQI